MATIRLPRDLSEFLRLLNSNHVEYLLIGGYAVNYHGYARTTGDMDIWIALNAENASRTASALRAFGYSQTTAEMFASAGRMVRMGVPPRHCFSRGAALP